MNDINKIIFKGIFEGKWISIEYQNLLNEKTRYWIAIKKILIGKFVTLIVDGLHTGNGQLTELRINPEKILSALIIEGSYYKTSKTLKEDIEENPDKYSRLFDNVYNLKILNYLADCQRLDNSPFECEYALINRIDDEKIKRGDFTLDDEQFLEIVKSFQNEAKSSNLKYKQLCLNILSVYTKDGLYVLAYRKLFLDVKNKKLRADNEITICKEFTIDGSKYSITRFLDNDQFYLLDDFYNNLQLIEDYIAGNIKKGEAIDDMPYIIAIAREVIVDLDKEYAFIIDRYNNNKVEKPIAAFFGEFLKLPVRRKDYPIALINRQINLDQLLAVHNAMKYPLTYVQGPPGTGKTNTIINTILTAFYNKKTLLFSSYNNHPLDAVFKKLTSMMYDENEILFPIIRLGNNEKVLEAANYIKKLYLQIKEFDIDDNEFRKFASDTFVDGKKLSDLMKKYDETIELKERKETIEKMLETNDNLNYHIQLQGVQLEKINNRINEIGKITEKDALDHVVDDRIFKGFLYYASIKCLKYMLEPRYDDLIKIIFLADEQERVKHFNRYLSNGDNLRKFIKLFPIVTTTCISAHKLGNPDVYFDMTVIDEASQCNIAHSLIPIIRGENLMLVGDPQQLNPVILLDEKDNIILKEKYHITDEYDYLKNSIYKTYVSVDAISLEILLSHHYRCHKKIIDFNNVKYYNSKLVIDSKTESINPLVFKEVENNETSIRNTSPKEAEAIIEYILENKDKQIGVITPFVKQKQLISQKLRDYQINNITCGTVHAFQGDEKNEILFSLCLTDKTIDKTYNWLKNNRELINVATSRAKNRLVIFGSQKQIDRLHQLDKHGQDDLYELVQYVKKKGHYEVTALENKSRALGIKPYSTEMEEALLVNLNHALSNVLRNGRKCTVYREVPISHVFNDGNSYNDLFYTGRFDFVVYQKDFENREMPIFAIELDGKEHYNDEYVKERDRKKNEICKRYGFDLIRVDNSYARRYNYMKEILSYYSATNNILNKKMV
ncbi:MAG: AAA domain-containing protein [Erysipelotrichaceae bacterium]|jgi:hypothetical protein